MSRLKIDYGRPISEEVTLNSFKSAALSGNLEELEPLTHNQIIKIFEPYDILEKVISFGQIEAAKMLINRQCFKSSKEDELLELAISTGNLELVLVLLKKIHCICESDPNKIPILFKVVDFFSDNLDKFSLLLDSFLEKKVKIDSRFKNDFTILHYAAEKGNKKVVLLLLDKGCEINIKSKEGFTPLHIAVKNGHSEVAELLLNNGADDTIFNNDKMTPLYLAVENEDFKIFKILFEFSRSSQTLNKQLLHNADNTLKTGKSILHIAVEKGNVEIVNELLNELLIFEPDFEAVDSEGFTPLHVACAKGNLRIICALLDTNKFELDARSKTGLTALHLAVKASHSVVVTLLLEHGADFKIVDQNSRTALSLAIESTNGSARLLEIILVYIRSLKNDMNGSLLTPQDQVLLEYYSLARKDEIGNSALHLAVQKEDAAAVVLLLKHQTCVDVLNKNHHSPLDLATINGSLTIVDIFLQSRDNPQSFFTSKKGNGYTPMHFAVENRNTDVLELFFKAGISVNISKPNSLTPLHIAVEKSDKDSILFLLKNGAKVDAPGLTDFETPLFMAAENGNTEVLEILLKASTTLSSDGSKGYLPMYIAAYNGHEKIVKMLLDVGVNPNANLDYYLTPLHAAAQKGHTDIVKFLLEGGAEVDPVRLHGCNYFSTPLLAASHSGHSSIMCLLLQHGANCNAKLKRATENLETIKSKHLVDEIDVFAKSDEIHTTHEYTQPVLECQKPVSKSERILIQGSYEDSEVGKKGLLFDYTSLHFAVEAGDEATVKLLLNIGANVYSEATDGKTAIGLAIEKEDKAVIKLFLSSGINFNLLSHNGMSIFQIKSLKTNLNLAQLIIDYATRDHYEPIVSSLRIAVSNDLEAYVENFFGTRVGEVDTGISETVIRKMLISAIWNKNATIVNIFLKNCLHNANFQSSFFLAVLKSSPQVVQKFLDCGFPVDMKDENGFTPLFYAVGRTNLEIVYCLLRNGASLKTTTDKGQTILYCALFPNTDLCYKYNCDYIRGQENYQDKKRIVQLLIQYGADVNSIFHNINMRINIKTLKQFCLLNTIDPNYLRKDELLEAALKDVDVEAVNFLLLIGANVDFYNEKKDYPFKIILSDVLDSLYVGEYNMNPLLMLMLRKLDDLEYDKQVVASNYTEHYEMKILGCREILRLLTKEVTRQLSVSNNISEQTLNCLHSGFVKNYFVRCQEEIERMKKTEISQNISYFDLLVANYDKLVYLVNVRDIRSIILRQNEVTALFPIYAEFLVDRIAIGLDRRRLKISSYNLLRKALHYEFSPSVVEIIFSFLSNNDLQNLNTAFIHDMFEE